MDLRLFYFHVTNYKMFSSSSVNAHHDITAFEVDGMLYNIENCISKAEHAFSMTQKNLKLCLKDYIFRSYHENNSAQENFYNYTFDCNEHCTVNGVIL